MLSPDYIVGLTDGEGSFTAYLRPPKKEHGSKNFRVECHYYIKLRDDDRMILEKVKKFWKTGLVVFQKDNRPNHHHNYRFQINNLNDLKNLVIPFFERHRLQSKKIKDFELFKKIVKAVIDKEHQTANGYRKIFQLKSKMHKYLGSPNTGNPFVRPWHGKPRSPDFTSGLGNGK